MSRSRGWIIVINNYTDDDMADYMNLRHHCRYYICAFEVGEKKGTPHIQGYCYFQDAKTRSLVSKLLPRASLQPARANGDKAFRRADYCRKESDWIEFGEEPTPGMIGKDFLQCLKSDPYANPHLWNQYSRMIEKLDIPKRDPFRKKEFLIFNREKLIDKLKQFDSVCFDQETYNYESAMHIAQYDSFPVRLWYNGYPPKIKRGYELITVDPDYVFCCYDDIKQKRDLRLKYLDYI